MYHILIIVCLLKCQSKKRGSVKLEWNTLLTRHEVDYKWRKIAGYRYYMTFIHDNAVNEG